MSELHTYGSALLVVRLFLHAITVWSIVSFMQEHRTKVFPTLLAIGIAGSSCAMFFQAATSFDRMAHNAEPWLVIYSLCMATICVVNGGNVAKPLPAAFRWFNR